MADIFISYAREDFSRAELLAKTLASRWSVWWDKEVTIGRRFPAEIDRELAAAKCVVVLWSQRLSSGIRRSGEWANTSR